MNVYLQYNVPSCQTCHALSSQGVLRVAISSGRQTTIFHFDTKANYGKLTPGALKDHAKLRRQLCMGDARPYTENMSDCAWSTKRTTSYASPRQLLDLICFMCSNLIHIQDAWPVGLDLKQIEQLDIVAFKAAKEGWDLENVVPDLAKSTGRWQIAHGRMPTPLYSSTLMFQVDQCLSKPCATINNQTGSALRQTLT
jgi:hypothetical protein